MPRNPLALLSKVLVALTIELDNEYEHKTIHSTTRHRAGGAAHRGPWLTSFAMYCNCLQFLSETPIPVRDLAKLARTGTNLDGMRRWGYIQLSPPAEKPNSKNPDENWLVALTSAGKMARENWRPLPQLIEHRWRERFGAAEVSSLRDVLLQMNLALDVAYPDFLPILGYALFTRGRGPGAERSMPPASDAPLRDDSPLTALLSRLLCHFAYEFERDSPISLAISANLLRVLDGDGIRNRDLPQRAGVSKEAIAMAMGILKNADLVKIGSEAGKLVRLTASGLAAQRNALHLIADVESRWAQHFGEATARRLGRVMEHFAGDPHQGSSPLLQGLKPYPDNWRAATPQLQTLPNFPMVLHRGGYPDGS